MQRALSNQIINLYKDSDCPVIITDIDYSLLGANDVATSVFGLQQIVEITKFVKTQIAENPSGAFVFSGEDNAYVETVKSGDASVRVIHVAKKLIGSDTNALFRSTANEMQYRRVIARLFQNLNKCEEILGEDFTQTERDIYSILELLNTTSERYKLENGLKPHVDSYFDVTHMMNSVVNQLDLVTSVSGIRVEFKEHAQNSVIVKCDKDCLAQAVIKLVRAFCRFASDDVVRISQTCDDKKVKFRVSVKSTNVFRWQEKNLSVDDLLSVVRNFDFLHDGILLTDSLYEFKCEGVETECIETDDETIVELKMPYEGKILNKLNSAPLNYIGDPFSTLTILFMGFEK